MAKLELIPACCHQRMFDLLRDTLPAFGNTVCNYYQNFAGKTEQDTKINDIVPGIMIQRTQLSIRISYKHCTHLAPFSRHRLLFVKSRKFFLPMCIWRLRLETLHTPISFIKIAGVRKLEFLGNRWLCSRDGIFSLLIELGLVTDR